MPSIRKLYRTILLLLWLAIGVILTVVFLRNTRPPHGFATNIISKWLGIVARIFGVKIKIYGIALPEKTLFVANHISWLDILILGDLLPIHFLSKYEVKTMPVIGWLATRAGTLYIKRGDRASASESSKEITAVLKQHHNSLIFAEGTTTDGHIKKFHNRMLQSAIDAQAMVQPVAIFYPVKNPKTKKLEINPVALFLGNTTIGESYNIIARSPGMDVEVHFLEPIDSSNITKIEVAQHAYEKVVDAIVSIKTRNE
ncbi:1-acyl-sn-glycerol-3-phosphate acyltransferase [hydrothermal vent metagenome]|uniref:1-acyl-sn-glycerol-3-phosphate acyltransferase n=1 Tax=hydrothermal vent metagenome TaxID=652676 RepID=A0A3B0W553_9ZZZZ